MKFLSERLNKIVIFIFHKTPLHIAVEKENEKIVELLLSNPTINVNEKIILHKNCYKYNLSFFISYNSNNLIYLVLFSKFQIQFKLNIY